MGVNYDLRVHRLDGETFGYMSDWGQEGQSPASVSSDPPDVPISTSSGVVTSGGPFSARDTAPPYPIEVSNWQDGAGQDSYDNAESSAEAFRASRNVDVTQASHFELGARLFHFAASTMENIVYPALGTFWAGLHPVTNGSSPPQYGQLAYLVRYRVFLSAGTVDASEVNFSCADWTADATNPAVDLSMGAAVTPMAGDTLYCPTHNEVILVNAVTEDDTPPTTSYLLDVTGGRAQDGTTAADHSTAAGEWLYGFGWRKVTFSTSPNNPPAQHVSALATDGKYVYAAFTNLAGSNGSIWRGTPTGTWTRWSETNNITNLVHAGGYFYASQDLLSDKTSVGYMAVTGTLPNDTGAYTALALSGSLQMGWNSAGLAESNNYAYWGVTDGYSRSVVYKVHNSTDDPFELVTNLPSGFVATCLFGHLGSVYVGGYFDNLANITGDTGLPRYEGALFVLVEGASPLLAARFRTSFDQESPYDTRVKGLCSAGPYILVLTVDDTYVYDTQHGGWSHAYNTSTGSISSLIPEEEWVDETAYPAFRWDSGSGNPSATTVASVYTGWDGDSDGYVDAAHNSNDVDDGAGFTTATSGIYKSWKVNAKTWKRYFILGGVDATAQKGTLHAVVSGLQSQAGALCLSDGVKEARVVMRGVMSGSRVTNYQFGLGWMRDVNGEAWDYEYTWSGKVDAKPTRVMLVFSPAGATLYINDKQVASTARAKLKNNSSNYVWWSVGWPGNMRRDAYNSNDDNAERITYRAVIFTARDAYTPDGTIGGVSATTTMKGIANMQGVTVVPIPGGGYDYIEGREIAAEGQLETSDSAFHMGSVMKYFVSVVVEHSPLQDGQSIYITPVKDDVPGGITSYVGDLDDADDMLNVGRTTSTAIINDQGKRIRVLVQLRDDTPSRPYVYRLRVFRITTKFFPVNSPHVHVYYLNCREGVQCRTGRDWGYDPEEAIRHLFAVADSGEVVTIESLFTSDAVDDVTGEVGEQRARIESVKLFQGPGDMQRYDKLTGTVQVKMRRVDQ